MKEYPYAVWTTQGGGLVKEVNETFVFVEVPEGMGLEVGDALPDQWDLIPANELARQEL
jgi:hypothetical protein